MSKNSGDPPIAIAMLIAAVVGFIVTIILDKLF